MIILNGSPNKESRSMALAAEHFPLDEAEIFEAYTMEASPCDDCKLCMKLPRCKFKDDTTTFIKALSRHDTLVIVSPVHFGALSAPTLKVISRYQELFNRKHTLKMPVTSFVAVHIVATAGADDPSMFEGLEKTHTILKRLLNADKGSLITKTGTDTQ